MTDGRNLAIGHPSAVVAEELDAFGEVPAIDRLDGPGEREPEGGRGEDSDVEGGLS